MANVLTANVGLISRPGPDMDPAGETHWWGNRFPPNTAAPSIQWMCVCRLLFFISRVVPYFFFFHPSSCRPSLYVIHEKLALHRTYMSKSTRLHSSLAWDKALMCLPALILRGSEVHEMISKEWSGRTKYLALHHIPHKYLSFFGFHFSRAGWRTDASRQTNVSGVAVWTLRAEMMSGRLMFGPRKKEMLQNYHFLSLWGLFSISSRAP